MEVKLMSDSRIKELNEMRNVPCIKESGECFLVRRFNIFNEDEWAQLVSMEDVNVFATEREAAEWIAMMISDVFFDTGSCIKKTYTVVSHRVEI